MTFDAQQRRLVERLGVAPDVFGGEDAVHVTRVTHCGGCLHSNEQLGNCDEASTHYRTADEAYRVDIARALAAGLPRPEMPAYEVLHNCADYACWHPELDRKCPDHAVEYSGPPPAWCPLRKKPTIMLLADELDPEREDDLTGGDE